MPPKWSTIVDDEHEDVRSERGHHHPHGLTMFASMSLADEDLSTGSSSANSNSRRSRTHSTNVDGILSATSATTSFRERIQRMRLRRRPRRPRVPSMSLITLYNRLQTASVVIVDCRGPEAYAAGHIRGALSCPHGRRSRHRTVDDVLNDHPENAPLQRKLGAREMLEVVVIGGHGCRRGLPIVPMRLDRGFRFAKMLLQEGRVFSVAYLNEGYEAFADKYPFLIAPHEQPMTQFKDQDYTHVEDGRQAKASSPSVSQYPNEIVENFLFLGNFWQANDPRVISDLAITHVVNMGAITDDRHKCPGVAYLDVAIRDREDVDIRTAFAPTVEFIKSATSQRGGRVLIHCVQGISRSSTIVIWYLMLETRCTLAAAYSYVLRRRPLIFPNRGFMEQLMANEKELYGAESVLPQELDLLQSGLLVPTDRKGSALRHSFV